MATEVLMRFELGGLPQLIKLGVTGFAIIIAIVLGYSLIWCQFYGFI